MCVLVTVKQCLSLLPFQLLSGPFLLQPSLDLHVESSLQFPLRQLQLLNPHLLLLSLLFLLLQICLHAVSQLGKHSNSLVEGADVFLNHLFWFCFSKALKVHPEFYNANVFLLANIVLLSQPLSVVSPAPAAPPSASSSLSPPPLFVWFPIPVHAVKHNLFIPIRLLLCHFAKWNKSLHDIMAVTLTWIILSISKSCRSFSFSIFSTSWIFESSDWLLRLLQLLRALRLRSRWLFSRWARLFSLSSWW